MKKYTIIPLILICSILLTSCAKVQTEMAQGIGEAYGTEVPDDIEEQYQSEWDSFFDAFKDLFKILAESKKESNDNSSSQKDSTKPGITLKTIPKNNIEKTESLTMKEFHPLLGLTDTMLSLDDSADAMLQEKDFKGFATPISPKLDVFTFLLSWLDNSTKITHLKVTTSKNDEINIDYGTSIELNRSGKFTTLSVMLVQKYFKVEPSIVFTCGKRADECLRNWFNLEGEGRYSMELNFGKVNVGDPGYRIIIENGKVYQYPIIHSDTTMKVYYKEKGAKKAEYLFDAANMLRNTRIEMADEEAKKVLNQLRKHGYID